MERVFICGAYAGSLVNFRGNLISDFIGMGYEVHVCATNFTSDNLNWLHQRNVKVHEAPFDRTGINPLSDVMLALCIRKLLLKIRPTISFFYTAKPVIYGGIASIGIKNRSYAIITGLGYAFSGVGIKAKLIEGVVKALYKFALVKHTGVLFQNPDDRNDFFNMGLLSASKPNVIINGSGVDLEKFPARCGNIDGDSVRFLFVGRLLNAKGVREYLEAASVILSSYGDRSIEFHLVGWFDHGNPDSCDEEFIKEMCSIDGIFYHGRSYDVVRHLNGASVFILPSYREGTPRSVLEAMAVGLPIITTNAPGCKETVEEGVNGFKVDVASSRQIVDACEQYINNREMIARHGAESCRIVKEKYDVKLVNQSILNFVGIDADV